MLEVHLLHVFIFYFLFFYRLTGVWFFDLTGFVRLGPIDDLVYPSQAAVYLGS